jgi:hypothetical protein
MDIFRLSLGDATDDMQKIAYNSSLLIDDSSLIYPEDAKLESVLNPDPTQPTEPSDVPDETAPSERQEHESGGWKSIFETLFQGFKKSIILIIGIVGCYVGIAIIQTKKKAAARKQAEEDQYDDRYIE